LEGRIAEAQTASPDTTRFFPGFKTFDVKTTGATIHGVGGSGPPLLLLHRAPQTHVTWRLVAPQLAKRFTVIAPDLRGYGDSSKPPDGESHVNYSKRAMALDQVEVMKQFGFDRFPVIGQDRGGRVGHRLALELFNVLAIWKERGTNVTGKGLAGGHYLQEDVPDQVVAELQPILRA
jgi:haloacetate dehalogenase